MATQFDLAQTFYLDKGSVNNAGVVHITSVELFFESKPAAGASKTNIYKPGVTLFIAPVSEQQPDINKAIEGSFARVEWDDVVVSGDASTSTKFTFARPIIVATDNQYAFLVKFDGNDEDFQLWWAQSGEYYLNTNIIASVSSGYNDGSMFKVTNGSVLTKNADADFKFKINVAKFSSTGDQYIFNERKYELFQYNANTITGDFKVGEYVYKNTAAKTGTLTISSDSANVTGSGGTTFDSDFAIGDYIVISDGTAGNTIIRIVASPTPTASSLVLDEKPHFSNSGLSYYKTAVAKVYLYDKKSDHMILTDSNANTTLYFANNSYVIGEDTGAQIQISEMKDMGVSRAMSQFSIVTPPFTTAEVSAAFSNSTYDTTDSPQTIFPVGKKQFLNYDGIIASRSIAMTEVGTHFYTGNVSVNGIITFTTSNQFSSPYVEEPDLDLFTYRYIINDDATNEVIGSGNAASKYVSKRVTLGTDQEAEDLRVYVTVYQPQGTRIIVYGRLLNSDDSESFSNKNWTALEEVNPVQYTSSETNKQDTVEKEYRIPFYPSQMFSFDGVYFTGQTGNNVLATTSNISANVVAGNTLIRVYQENTPNNFFVSLVTAANSSTITLQDAVSNVSFNIAGLKAEKFSTVNKYSAFINPQNKNICRYYTSDWAPKDTYKIFAIKIVLLSQYEYKSPLVNNVRAIAVSA